MGWRLFNQGLPRPLPILELKLDQELGELTPPPGQLTDQVGADLARGREDAEEIAASVDSSSSTKRRATGQSMG
jgi:hypothetical protein